LDLLLFEGEASAKDSAVLTNCESNDEQPVVGGENGGSRANLLSSITGFNKSNLRKAQSVDSSH
jgi:WH2 motif